MDTFLIGNIGGAIVLDERRAKKNTNDTLLYPVKARLTYLRKRIYISLGFDLTEEVFNEIFGWKIIKENEIEKKVKTKQNLKKQANKSQYELIITQFERIKEKVEEIHKEGEYSHEKLLTKLKKGRRDYIEIAFSNKINELNKKGQAGTAAAYETAKNFISKYKSNVKFIDITSQWLTDFEQWALNESRSDELTKKGIRETSLSIYLRSLRALFYDAISDGLPKSAFPFYSKEFNPKGYRIPDGEGTKIALTVEQLQSIVSMELTGSKERCRDMFLLSFYLGGINFKDMLLLKWKNIKNSQVYFVREKTKNTKTTTHTGKSIIVPLVEPAKTIIERWGNDDKSLDAFVIPYLADDLTPQKLRDSVKSFTKQVNKQLKEIGKELSIEGLSSMVARHTLATVLKNSGAPIAFIGETLGHSSTKTTENYLKSFETEQRRKQFDVIAKIGNNNNSK